jgi:hypothetical protein
MTGCPECGAPLAGDETICPACGAGIEEPGPEEAGAEIAPSVEPQGESDGEGRRCPECGALNPAEARFCVGCRHAFAKRAPFLGAGWLVVPALITVILIVVAVAALSFGFISIGSKASVPTVKNSSAHAGANDTVRQVLDQSRNATRQNATEVVIARNATGTTAANTTATLLVTSTRAAGPVGTPWNGAEGAGRYHDGGTHNVEVAGEILARRPTTTPLPYSAGNGSGHATAPLSWVGTGNWSPGFIDLPVGDAQVVLLSQGTTAFVLADAVGARVGFGVFLPPGGTHTVPIQQAGRYVIAFGTANATDSWSATVLLPGSGGQAAAPPVAAPATQILSFAGTGGGSPESFNLSPGTVHVALTADQMTMAYLKDMWGVTLLTAVAGPYPGGSTAAITRTGPYRLEVWGAGTWSATVTWAGTPATGAATLPTVQPVTTLTPWNATAAPSPSSLP